MSFPLCRGSCISFKSCDKESNSTITGTFFSFERTACVVKTERIRRPYFPNGTFVGEFNIKEIPLLAFRINSVLFIFLKGKEAVVKKLGI